MEFKITIASRDNLDPAVEFPVIFSDWGAGVQEVTEELRGDLGRELTKHDHPYTKYTRTVTTEGLHGAVSQKYGPISAPQYPPAYIATWARCPEARLAEILADTRMVVAAIDDIGEGVPTGWENKGLDNPMDIEKDGEFRAVRAKLKAWTNGQVGADEADQVVEVCNNYRDDHEGFTPRMLFGRLRRFVA